jgi:hypothetical protein
MCRSKKNVNAVERQEDSYLEETLFVGAVTSEVRNDEWYVTTKIEKQNTKLKVDTGLQVNILNLNQLEKIKSQPSLKESTHKLISCTGNNLAVLGTTELCVESEINQSRNLTFYVVDTNQPGLLGLRAAQELGLLKIVGNTRVNSTAKKPPAHLKEEVIKKHQKIFTGLGRLEREYHIEVDPTVTPVINPSRTIPAALRSGVKVEEPTDWVSSMVVVEKPNGKLRICLDPKHLNKAIKREHFQLPTIEDITTRMANAKRFSKLDANHGYLWTRKVNSLPLSTLLLADIATLALHLVSPQHKKFFRKGCINISTILTFLKRILTKSLFMERQKKSMIDASNQS